MDDGGLPVFNKKIGPMKELRAVGFLHFVMMLYISLLLVNYREK